MRGKKKMNKDYDDMNDFFNKLNDKIGQIPKSDIEKSQRIEDTLRDMKEWLNNGGFTIHDIVSMLELLKQEYMNDYQKGMAIFRK